VEIRTVITRLSVVAVGCALSVSVAAQQSAPAAPASAIAQASDEQLERTRTEVRTFEIVLFQAIEAAGQKLASWAAPMAPTVMLTPAAAPIITGLLLPDSSLIFEVRIPELLPGGVMIFNDYQRLPKPQVRQGLPGQNPGQAISSDRVTTTTVVADDPMKGAAVSPDKMYSDFVRLGLMDAILDSSSVLTLRENQWLSVAAVPVDVAVTNPLYRNTSRKLILSIKAEDLAAFRAGKITRDEAKLKIVDTRF
jgi:hypothetical protein